MRKLQKDVAIIVCFAFSICNLPASAKNNSIFIDTTSMAVFKKTSGSTRIMVIGDINDSYGSSTYSSTVTKVVEKIPDINPDLLLIAGDMIAGQSASLTNSNVESMWKGFNTFIREPLVAYGIPYLFTVGNHDASPWESRDRTFAEAFWKNESNKPLLNYASDDLFPYFYSAVQSEVFVLVWDASAASQPSTELLWLKEQLTSSEAQNAKMIIVLGHLPLAPYSIEKNKAGEYLSGGKTYLDLFKLHGVDMYISGHQHVHFPGRAEGVELMGNGILGSGQRTLLGMSKIQSTSFTLIELQDSNLRIMGVKAPDFTPFAQSEFPESIKSGELLVHHRNTVIETTSSALTEAAQLSTTAPVQIDMINGQMKIIIRFADTYEISLFDLNGQKIESIRNDFSVGNSYHSISNMNFASSLAIVQISSSSYRSVQKILIK